MVYSHSQPAIDDLTTRVQQDLEFLRIGNHGQDHADVLCGLAKFL